MFKCTILRICIIIRINKVSIYKLACTHIYCCLRTNLTGCICFHNFNLSSSMRVSMTNIHRSFQIGLVNTYSSVSCIFEFILILNILHESDFSSQYFFFHYSFSGEFFIDTKHASDFIECS